MRENDLATSSDQILGRRIGGISGDCAKGGRDGEDNVGDGGEKKP